MNDMFRRFLTSAAVRRELVRRAERIRDRLAVLPRVPANARGGRIPPHRPTPGTVPAILSTGMGQLPCGCWVTAVDRHDFADQAAEHRTMHEREGRE